MSTTNEEFLESVRTGRRTVASIAHPCTGVSRIIVKLDDGSQAVLYGPEIEELETLARTLQPTGDQLDEFVRALL